MDGLQLGLQLGPRATERPTDTHTTVLGTLDTSVASGAGGDELARVDGGGLVGPTGAGWSLDWWIGADDRWYLPAREPSVRQRRLGPGPVIETTVRIPSGDARHTAYGAVVDGRPVTVVEVENDSPVPVALAIALRPYPVGGDAAGRADDAVGPLVLDGSTLRVGPDPAVALPRPPGQWGASPDTDLLGDVLAGRDLASPSADGPAGPVANGVALYPLPHRTSLRFLVLGPAPVPAVGAPSVDGAPPIDAVVRGWGSIVGAAARYEFPDPGLTALLGGARARLLLAAPGLGRSLEALAPGAGSVLAGLALTGHRDEAGQALEVLAAGFPTELDPSVEPDGGGPAPGVLAAAEIVAAAATAVGLGVRPPTDGLLEVAAQITHLVERHGRPPRRRLLGRSRSSTADREATGPDVVVLTRAALGHLVAATGDDEAARRLRGDGPGGPLGPTVALAAAPWTDGAVDPERALERGLDEMAEAASATGGWDGPDGPDSAGPAGRFTVLARRALIDDTGPGLDLVPGHRPAWRGGQTEVHDAPTTAGALAYAMRWHGPRPALLWELDPSDPPAAGGNGPVLRCSQLDDGWTGDTLRGETLLTGSADALPDTPAPGDSFS